MRMVRGLRDLHIIESCWLLQRGLVGAVLPATLLDMARRGTLTIHETSRGFDITIAHSYLAPLERAALQLWFGSPQTTLPLTGVTANSASKLATLALFAEEHLQQRGHVRNEAVPLRNHLRSKQILLSSLAASAGGLLGAGSVALVRHRLLPLLVVAAILTPLVLALWATTIWFNWHFSRALAKPLANTGQHAHKQLLDLRALQHDAAKVDAVFLTTTLSVQRSTYEWLLPYAILFKRESFWLERLTSAYQAYPSWYIPAGHKPYDATLFAQKLEAFVAAGLQRAGEPTALIAPDQTATA